MDITEDIRPLTEFKRDTGRFLSRLRSTGRPSVLTVNGRPALVVIDARAWQEVQDQLDYAAAVAGIRKGLDQARAGRGARAKTFFEEFQTQTAAE